MSEEKKVAVSLAIGEHDYNCSDSEYGEVELKSALSQALWFDGFGFEYEVTTVGDCEYEVSVFVSDDFDSSDVVAAIDVALSEYSKQVFWSVEDYATKSVAR